MRTKYFLVLFLALNTSLPAKALTPYEAEREIFLANPEAQRSAGMASSLLAMSVAALGSVMATTCRPRAGLYLPQSLVAFSNAASAYVMSEIISANLHKEEIAARNADVQRLADRLRQDGGGEVQKRVFEESKKEREFLFQFVGMRRDWVSALILGYFTAASIAGDEDNVPENQVICTGTLEAASSVAVSLGLAYKAQIGQGPTETVASYLTGVLAYVAAQILPMVETPSSRITMANLAADASTAMLGELSGLGTIVEGNIADLTRAMDEFISSSGVPEDSGIPNEKPEGPGTEESRTTTTSASTSVASAPSGSASVSAVGTGNSAVNIRTKTCTERSPDGKSLVFKEVCARPAVFTSAPLKRGSITTKTAADALSKFATALALGDIEAAKLHASSLNALAARIISGKKEVMKNINLVRINSGRPMIDLDRDTKTAIERMTAGIKAEVIKRGGEKILLASTSQMSVPPPAVKVIPEEEFVADLPARLRWKKFHRNSIPDSETLKSEAPAAPAKELSLWERLTIRYHERFFEKKEPTPTQP
jgi:hypothetical protein